MFCSVFPLLLCDVLLSFLRWRRKRNAREGRSPPIACRRLSGKTRSDLSDKRQLVPVTTTHGVGVLGVKDFTASGKILEASGNTFMVSKKVSGKKFKDSKSGSRDSENHFKVSVYGLNISRKTFNTFKPTLFQNINGIKNACYFLFRR